MADQLLYDIQQVLGYLQTIAENTKRMADALDELTLIQQEEACSAKKTVAPDSVDSKKIS